ncbi:g patch domain-containing protein 4-like protein [Dermatophagoides farinae]|uniref:G patch domain-containing protein 4-like protein n=1 Tax=Dermatophagoides farinae TaxID=6954 RepID=A0A9D4SG55_DERFA|nr:PIN2/TERF1-interacting telomerase inhibitor 1-like [Dermatophagoides farinae]KAH7640418.1 g patch domain-containing protein 4-like protein [Dermatophagoides farinae]
MLAERKQKVIYSNPRGTLWANDKQKFGQRMLESMGWQEGQGLGKDQTGITESIKPSFKFDNKGLGYKTKSNDWIEDNNVYEQILSDLSKYHKPPNNSDAKKNEIKDLEKKTKSSNRLHYRKFIRAKNLSIKSEQDLFCIFPTVAKEKKKNSNDEELTMMKRKSSEIISNSNDDDDEHTICLRSDKCVMIGQ